MSPGDFLHKGAETRHCEQYIAAGAVCRFSTNSERLLEAVRGSFLPVTAPTINADFSLRVWVDFADPAQPPWPKPYVRGLDHLVFAGFDAGSSVLADLRTRRVIGRFSARMAADIDYWQSVVLPMVLTIVSASVGIAELHCACVAHDQAGLLLAGPSGSGKSTLALALAQIGYEFLSDDRTFVSLAKGAPQAWGLPTQCKLRADAGRWFGELRDRELTLTRGEPAYWFDPRCALGVTRALCCRPNSVLFLQRQDVTKFELNSLLPAEARELLREDLLPEFPDAAAKRSITLEKLIELPCWLLKYGGEPQTIAQQISHYFAQLD